MQDWFSKMCSLSKQHCLTFDKDVQKINEIIFQTYCETMHSKKSKKKAMLFHRKIFDKIVEKDVISKLIQVKDLQDQGGVAHLILALTRWFWDRLLAYSKSRMQAASVEEEQQGPSLKREVNRFVGWAVSQLLKKYKTEKENDSAEGDDDSQWDKHWELLKLMRIAHQEAILNEDYKKNCYEPLDMLSNLGGLTLVSPQFFPFGKKLMNVVGVAVTEDKIVQTGKECINLGGRW